MTQRQFIEEIKRLSVAERVALIEAISRDLRAELEMNNGEASAGTTDASDVTGAQRLETAQRLGGMLKMKEPPMSKEAEREIYAERLTEKHS